MLEDMTFQMRGEKNTNRESRKQHAKVCDFRDATGYLQTVMDSVGCKLQTRTTINKFQNPEIQLSKEYTSKLGRPIGFVSSGTMSGQWYLWGANTRRRQSGWAPRRSISVRQSQWQVPMMERVNE